MYYSIFSESQFERDPTPLHRAAKESINMQLLKTGEFPQQVGLHFSCVSSSTYFIYRWPVRWFLDQVEILL
jgi:hypothetical protein